eukprot:1900985-Pleurochrysis_carterae.AAC.1
MLPHARSRTQLHARARRQPHARALTQLHAHVREEKPTRGHGCRSEPDASAQQQPVRTAAASSPIYS